MNITSRIRSEIVLLSIPVVLLVAVPVSMTIHNQKSNAVSGRLVGTWRNQGAGAPYVLTTFKANGDWEERCFDGSGQQEQLYKGRYVDSGNTFRTYNTKRYRQILGVDSPIGTHIDGTKTTTQQASPTAQASEPTFLCTIASANWRLGVIKVRLPTVTPYGGFISTWKRQ